MGAAWLAEEPPSAAATPPSPRHRPDYVLERGVWRVSCRVCGWEATDSVRRQLACRFRFHLQTSPAPPAEPGS
jgi:hypothetical protein